MQSKGKGKSTTTGKTTKSKKKFDPKQPGILSFFGGTPAAAATCTVSGSSPNARVTVGTHSLSVAAEGESAGDAIDIKGNVSEGRPELGRTGVSVQVAAITTKNHLNGRTLAAEINLLRITLWSLTMRENVPWRRQLMLRVAGYMLLPTWPLLLCCTETFAGNERTQHISTCFFAAAKRPSPTPYPAE